jgi:hypothetical protein
MSEAILEPDLPIIDPHHHLWDRRAANTGNLPPPKHGFEAMLRMVPHYMFPELLADMKSGHNVIGTVYMECGSMYRAGGDPAFRCVGETEFVNGVAAVSASGLYGDSRACAGIVGHVDLNLTSSTWRGPSRTPPSCSTTWGRRSASAPTPAGGRNGSRVGATTSAPSPPYRTCR